MAGDGKNAPIRRQGSAAAITVDRQKDVAEVQAIAGCPAKILGAEIRNPSGADVVGESGQIRRNGSRRTGWAGGTGGTSWARRTGWANRAGRGSVGMWIS